MPTTMRLKRRRLRHAARLDQRARPQRVGALLDDLAVDLLAPEPRAGVARQHLVEKAGDRCAALACVAARVTAVRGSATSRLISAIGRGVVVMSCARPRAEPQAELQHVEGRVAHSATWRARRTRRRRIAARAAARGPPPRTRTPPRRSAIPAAGATPVHCGRSLRGDARRRPDGPSIITSRTSCFGHWQTLIGGSGMSAKCQ